MSVSKLRVPLDPDSHAMVTWLSRPHLALAFLPHLPTSLCRNVRGLRDPQPAALSGCSHPRPPAHAAGLPVLPTLPTPGLTSAHTLPIPTLTLVPPASSWLQTCPSPQPR